MHMQRKSQGLEQTKIDATMTSSLNSVMFFIVFVLLLSVSAVTANAQSAVPSEDSCFAIHVRLNGKAIDAPQTVILKTRDAEKTAHLDKGCIVVPGSVLKEKEVDVLFTVPGNKLYMSGIQGGFLVGSWDVELEDKRFGKDVVLPHHARTKNTCVVVFHVGEPETVRSFSACRMRL